MDARRKWGAFRAGATFAFLFAAWFAFSPSAAPSNVAAGAAAALFVAFLSYDVFIERHEAGRRSVLPRPLRLAFYLVRLLAAMYASAFRVLLSVATGRIDPRVVHFKTRLRSDLARVALAHAVTFTPGTIVLDLDEDHYLVHWLLASTRHSAAAGESIKGDLEKRLKEVWS